MPPDPLNPEFWRDHARRRRQERGDRFFRPEFWDRLADRYDELEASPFYQEMVSEVVETMRRRGALGPGKRVLDVACGPGNYAVRFAPLVQEVVGLDVSSRMIARFRERLDRAGFSNYRAIQADWFSFETEETFETVFASMTPLLQDMDAVDRMVALAREFLVLVHWAGVRRNELHARLVREVTGRELRWDRAGIIVPFNYLYARGLAGDLRFFCGYWERTRTLEQEEEHLRWRLDGEGISLDARQRARLRELLAREADEEGRIVSRTRVRLGFLVVELSGPCPSA